MTKVEEYLKKYKKPISQRDLSRSLNQREDYLLPELKRLESRGLVANRGRDWVWTGGKPVPAALISGPGAIRIELQKRKTASVKSLSSATGWSEAEVRSTLSMLEISGQAKKRSDGKYQWVGAAPSVQASTPRTAKVQICGCSERLRDTRTGRFVKGGGKRRKA